MKFSKNELSSHSLNPVFHRLLTELHTRQCQYSRKKQEPYIQLTCITFMCADMTCSHKTLKFDLSKSRERDIHTHTWKLNYSLFLKDDFVFSDQTMLKTRSIQWGYNPGITGRHGGEITIVLTFFSYIGLWYAPLWSSPVQQASENRWRERGEESSLQVYYICQALACRKRNINLGLSTFSSYHCLLLICTVDSCGEMSFGRLTQKRKILLARWWYYQLGYGPSAFGIKACSRPFSIKLSSMMGWPLRLGWSLKIKKAYLSSPIVLDKWGYCFPCH